MSLEKKIESFFFGSSKSSEKSSDPLDELINLFNLFEKEFSDPLRRLHFLEKLIISFLSLKTKMMDHESQFVFRQHEEIWRKVINIYHSNNLSLKHEIISTGLNTDNLIQYINQLIVEELYGE